jgi:hypothetical protein
MPQKKFLTIYEFNTLPDALDFFQKKENKNRCFFKIKTDDTSIYFINVQTMSWFKLGNGGSGIVLV